MNSILKAMSLVVFSMLSGCQVAGRDPLLRLTLLVVDDQGSPVEAAYAGFGGAGRPKSANSEGKAVRVDGLTDRLGIFTGEIAVWDATHSGYEINKPGYYTSWASFSAHPPVSGKWQPWNPTIKVVLKRIRNPVPMYAKRVTSSLPKLNVPVGYDLEMGDWVLPYGNGKTADIIFVGELNKKGDRIYDWRMKLTFSNPGDGIQRFKPEPEPVYFRSPYEAPEEGYFSVWDLHRSRTGPNVMEQTNYEEAGGYFLRVRSVSDKNGKVVKALYGKIYGDFFNMVHYLNPDGTRNMEYDSKRNLLKAPKSWDSRYYEVGP